MEAAALAKKVTKGSIVLSDRVIGEQGIEPHAATPLEVVQLAVAALLSQEQLQVSAQGQGYQNILVARASFLNQALDYLAEFARSETRLRSAA